MFKEEGSSQVKRRNIEQIFIADPEPTQKNKTKSAAKRRELSPIIKRNIDFVDKYDASKRAELQFKQRISQDAKQLQCQINKQSILERQYKYNAFLLVKWDIIKHKKVELQELAIQKAKRKRCNRFWAKGVRSLAIFKTIFAKF